MTLYIAPCESLMNRLLACLPSELSQRLLKSAEQVELPSGVVLYEPYETPRFAYFPLRGVCSVVTQTMDGHGVETGMLGYESCTAATHLMGEAGVPLRFVQQISGVSLRIPYAHLRREFQDCELLRNRVLEFVQVWSLSMAQMVACQRLHQAEQRLARWLLMARARANTDIFHLNQEFLAEMLGSGRPRVTQLLLQFREAGLIEVKRQSLLALRNVQGLEKLACECHGVIAQLYAGLYQCAQKAPVTFRV